MLLLPKEHGAYGQMALPLITSLAVAGITLPALLLTLGVVAGGLAIASAIMALWSAPPEIRWSFGLPVVPTACFATAIAMKREKSWQGEVTVALAFSLVAVPVSMAARVPANLALAVALAFALTFVSGTLAVRGIILEVRGGGNPRAARATRHALIATAVVAVVGLSVAAIHAVLPWATLVAAAPGLVTAVWFLLFRLPPTRLRTVGWSLVGASTAAAVILAASLTTQ